LKKDAGHKGFSLLEILTAVSIIAIVFTSVFKLHGQTISMSATTNFNTLAPILAQGKLAEYDAVSADAVPDNTGDYGEGYPEYTWEIAVDDVTSEAFGKDLKRIDIRVSYHNGEDVYALRTYRFIPE
jgi:general secretion pathway protein I